MAGYLRGFYVATTGVTRLATATHAACYALDGREISHDELATFNVMTLKRLVVYKGDAAVARLGSTRAKNGLVLLSERNNEEIQYNYIGTPLLETVYPKVFTRR